jgi:hypothetical protein
MFGCTSSFSITAIVGTWTLLSLPFHPSNRSRSWKRVIRDKIFYYLTTQLNIKQMQWAVGDAGTVYKKWTMQNGLPFEVDELGEETRLFGSESEEPIVSFYISTARVVFSSPRPWLIFSRRRVFVPAARLCDVFLAPYPDRAWEKRHSYGCRDPQLRSGFPLSSVHIQWFISCLQPSFHLLHSRLS